MSIVSRATKATTESPATADAISSAAAPATMTSMVDWLSSAIQDALVTEELDPGLFHRRNQPDRQRMRLDHFAILLESAIEAPAGPRASAAP